MTLAEVRANSGEKKRVSWPTMIGGILVAGDDACSAMALEARRTPGKGEIVGDDASPAGSAGNGSFVEPRSDIVSWAVG